MAEGIKTDLILQLKNDIQALVRAEVQVETKTLTDKISARDSKFGNEEVIEL